MLRLALWLRFVTLIASVGAALGAMLMFWEGSAKLAGGIAHVLLPDQTAAKSIVASVMEATDAYLFGLVLLIFAYAIMFGFALNLSHTAWAKLPSWMRVDGINELKRTLIEVILVYLVVDFATDVAEAEASASWEMLVKPMAILLIAGALRLIGNIHPESHERPSDGPAASRNPDQP
jgi:uncharacterized membrane protein YqhA